MMKRVSTLLATTVLAAAANASTLSYFDDLGGTLTLTGATLTLEGNALFFGSLFNPGGDGTITASANVKVDFMYSSPDDFVIDFFH